MKRIVLFVVCFFLVMNGVDAISMSCPEIASPLEEISIKVSDKELNGLKGKYNFGVGFGYQDFKVNAGGKVYYGSSDGFSVGNVTNLNGIDADIVVKVSGDIPVGKDYVLELVDINGSNREYKNVNIDNVNCSIKMVNDINTLDSLEIDGVKLKPSFDKNVTSYQATTDKDKINVKTVLSDSSAKIEGAIGEQKLNVGANYFVIKVISARGNVREYKLYITRKISNNNKGDNSSNNKLSSDASLKSLTINKGNLKFKSDTFLYKVDVLSDVSDIEVKAVANSNRASVVIDKPEKLVVGENVIKIEVTAEDGTKATYMIVVNRQRELSSDNFIENLKIENYNLNFKRDKYKYILEIDGEDKLGIDVVLSDKKAKYVIKGNKGLKSGSIISIIVTAENGKKRTYEIAISKLGENNVSNIINNLSLVSIVGFILLIIVVLIIKLFKSKVNRNIEK